MVQTVHLRSPKFQAADVRSDPAEEQPQEMTVEYQRRAADHRWRDPGDPALWARSRLASSGHSVAAGRAALAGRRPTRKRDGLGCDTDLRSRSHGTPRRNGGNRCGAGHGAASSSGATQSARAAAANAWSRPRSGGVGLGRLSCRAAPFNHAAEPDGLRQTHAPAAVSVPQSLQVLTDQQERRSGACGR